jgi:hypothetical protein
MTFSSLLLAVFLLPAASGAQTDAATEQVARLYYSAAFEEALAVLERSARGGLLDEPLAEEYRAACLIALGREEDARAVMDRLVRAQPYRPARILDASPATQALYSSIRQAVLGDILRGAFIAGTAAMRNGDPAAAEHEFATVLRIADALPAGADRDLVDLATLSRRFLDVAQDGHAPAADRERYYSAADSGVAVPTAIVQVVPPPPGSSAVDFSGTAIVELLLSDSGAVVEVHLHQGIHPAYDPVVIGAARTWRYTPAMLDGRPVPFRKLLRIDVR